MFRGQPGHTEKPHAGAPAKSLSQEPASAATCGKRVLG